MSSIPYATLKIILDKPEEPIHQRLSQLIEKLEGGVQRRFARQVGIAAGVVNDILGQRKSKPGFDIISKILQAYPQIRAEWLMRGDGEMLKSSEPSKNNSVSSSSPSIELHFEPDTLGNKRAPWINYKAAANYLTGYQSQERYEEVEIVTLPPELMPGKQAYTVFTVTGESMEPTFFADDLVICQQVRSERWLDLRNENLMVVVSRTHGIQVKRVTVRKALRIIVCRSDNPRSQPLTISIDDEGDKQSDVLELWMVEWLMTKRTDAPSKEDSSRIATVENEVMDLRYLLETVIDEREMARRLRLRDYPPNPASDESSSQDN